MRYMIQYCLQLVLIQQKLTGFEVTLENEYTNLLLRKQGRAEAEKHKTDHV